MPRHLILCLMIEILLIGITVMLVVQPQNWFRFKSTENQQRVFILGLLFVSITFCYSMVFGGLIAISQLPELSTFHPGWLRDAGQKMQ